MNNCYLWMRDHGEEYVEEQDRSLQVVEVSWPTVRQPFQIDQMLDDEELPELSISDPDSHSNNDDTTSLQRSPPNTTQAERDVRNGASGIPASVGSSSQSLMRTPHRKKFLSRSHNSLVFRPPDYSKVESKVKKYIASMKEQQQERRQRHQIRFDPVPSAVVTRALGQCSELKTPEEVANLKRQLADQEVRVEVLQENHDRLLLDNARLQNMMDEMRSKIRIQHAHLHQPRSQERERRTNSPHRPEVDKDPSSHESLLSVGGDGSLGVVQLSLNHQHQALSITPTSYLDLPPLGQSGRKAEDDETSSCDSSWNSISRHYQQQMESAAVAPVEHGLDNENIIKQAVPEECCPLPENNDKQDILLLKQLEEITLAALELRDQTRSIIRQINLIKPPLTGEN